MGRGRGATAPARGPAIARSRLPRALSLLLSGHACLAAQARRPGAGDASADGGAQLPRPDPPCAGEVAERWEDSTPGYPRPVRAPAESPDVLLVLLDDVGSGMCSTSGGPVPTPHLERLAAEGLTGTRFHTTAPCSPTRAAPTRG